MDNILGHVIKEIANMPNDMQVEVFRTIASFPAITLPVLEMTSNELAGVFESSRGVPLQEPGGIEEQGGGDGVTTMKPTWPGRTRAAQKKPVLDVDSGDGDDGEDEHTDEEAPVEERWNARKRKARTQTLSPISDLFLFPNDFCHDSLSRLISP